MPSRRSPNLPREVPACGGKMRRRRECTFWSRNVTSFCYLPRFYRRTYLFVHCIYLLCLVTRQLKILVRTNTVEPLLWDTSIQGTQNLVPEKGPRNLCIYYLYWRDTSIQKNGTLFSGSRNLCLTSISGDTLALKKWLSTKRVDVFFKCTLITIMGAFTNWSISLIKSMQCICLKLTHNVEIRNKQSVVLCAIGQADLRSKY